MERKQDRAWQQAIRCLPPPRAAALAALDGQDGIEELRLRAGLPPSVRRAGREEGLVMPPVTAEELRDTLSRAARWSVHSHTDSLRNGFVTLAGGHRLGVCGQAATENGQVAAIRGVSSLNLRVARQHPALAAQIAPWIGTGAPQSALLVSPPGLGKTTLLREWVRLISDRGYPVAVADERSEVAALADGAPQFAVGRCTDVLDGCAKKQAALMLLKTMSPALLAFDEITAPADVEAVSLCAHCGVAVLATAHAADADGLRRRPLYRRLLALGVFRRAVFIGWKGKERVYRMEEWEESICSS